METDELVIEVMGVKVRMRDMLLYLFFQLPPEEQQEFWRRFVITAGEVK